MLFTGLDEHSSTQRAALPSALGNPPRSCGILIDVLGDRAWRPAGSPWLMAPVSSAAISCRGFIAVARPCAILPAFWRRLVQALLRRAIAWKSSGGVGFRKPQHYLIA
jgi:hypothetical protein